MFDNNSYKILKVDVSSLFRLLNVFLFRVVQNSKYVTADNNLILHPEIIY